MPKPRNVAREIGITFVVAALFGLGLYAYISSSMPKAREQGAALSRPSGDVRESDLDRAMAAARHFITELNAGRFDAAYGLMSSGYRELHSLNDFRESCAAAPLLARAERATLSRTRREIPAGGAPHQSSLLGIGTLSGSAGSIDATFTFREEAGELRILVLALAGTPVLDGVTGKR